MNQSLIYHYYPSKEDLWNKVKEDLMASFSEKGTTTPNMSEPSLENVLDVLFTRRIEFYRENDDIVRLFKWQALEGGWGSSPAQKKYLMAWVKCLEALQSAKKIRSDIKATQILTLIMGAGWAPFSHLPNPLVQDEEALSSYLKNTKDFLIASLSL
jgi:AcrR family transcriptional regulator